MRFRIKEERKKEMLTFESILPEIIDDLKLEESFFITSLKEKWESYVGKTLSVHSVPDRIFKKTLFVSVDHSAYSNELSLHSTAILKKIGDDFGPEFLYNIRFEIIKKGRYRK